MTAHPNADILAKLADIALSLLKELVVALDSASIRVHRKRDGLLIINARGKSRFMTLRERIAYWLLQQSTEIQP